ncbi:MAG: amino acid permease, partial [Alistipes onderdonkii]
GIGFLAVLFSFIVTFFPPSQLPVGSPATYTWLVAVGTLVFLSMPFIISFAMDRRGGTNTPGTGK